MVPLAQVGGNCASLGEMIRELTKEGVQVPGAFAATALAQRLDGFWIGSNDLSPLTLGSTAILLWWPRCLMNPIRA